MRKSSTILDNLPGVGGFRDAIHCINDNHLLLALRNQSAGMSDPYRDIRVRKVVWKDDAGFYRALKSSVFKGVTELGPTYDIEKVEEFLEAEFNVDSTDKLLTARASTHGEFEDNAAVGQALREVVKSSRNYPSKLSMAQREALEYVLGKISRIVSGDPNHLDHWQDIIGYCQIAVESIEGLKKLKLTENGPGIDEISKHVRDHSVPLIVGWDDQSSLET